jgi:hypothetical protein
MFNLLTLCASYINGLAMHGVESAEELLSDPTRIGFIQRALDSASLIIQTQYESEAFRQAFRYTMVRFSKLSKQMSLHTKV